MDNIKANFRRIWGEVRWMVIGFFWLLSLFLGFWGFSIFGIENGFRLSFTDRMYRTVQLISMNSGAVEGKINWILDVARFLLPALTAFTAFQVVIDLFREQTLWIRLWGLNNHIIVCGLGRKGSYIVDDLLRKDQLVVVIENNIDPVTANKYRQKGAIIVEGDARDAETLKKSRILKSSHLICLLGDDRENVKIALTAYQVTLDRLDKKLICIIHLNSHNFLELIKRSVMSIQSDDLFVLETFNVYERIAIKLLKDFSKSSIVSKTTNDNMLIIGLGRLGQSILTNVGFQCYQHQMADHPKITVFDIHADKIVSNLLEKYPQLASSTIISPLQIDVSSNSQFKKQLTGNNNLSDIQQIFVCLGDPILSVQVTLSLRELPELANTPIHVRLAKTSGLADLLETPIAGQFNHKNLYAFDLYEETCSANLVLKGVHELLAIKLRENYLDSLGAENYDAKKYVQWEEVSAIEKEANRQQANRIYYLLKTCDYGINPLQNWDAVNFFFTEDEVEEMARLEHKLWCQWKLNEGWHYGETKSERLKTHPDLLSWEKLTESEREKNREFIRRIPSLLVENGFQVDKVFYQ